MTVLERILTALQSGGFETERVEEGALVSLGEQQLTLFAEEAQEGGVLVQAHLLLDLYLDEQGLDEMLLGLNLMNQGLSYGALILDPLEAEDEDDDVTFAVLGRAALWLTGLTEAELGRLGSHLRRFADEVAGALARAIQSEGGLRA